MGGSHDLLMGSRDYVTVSLILLCQASTNGPAALTHRIFAGLRFRLPLLQRGIEGDFLPRWLPASPKKSPLPPFPKRGVHVSAVIPSGCGLTGAKQCLYHKLLCLQHSDGHPFFPKGGSESDKVELKAWLMISRQTSSPAAEGSDRIGSQPRRHAPGIKAAGKGGELRPHHSARPIPQFSIRIRLHR